MKLSDSKVAKLKPTGADKKYFDGMSMYLLVTANGGKLWRLKYYFGGKEKLLALGLSLIHI